ncbi:MAG: CBS domain-containing protein [Mariprofundus sp.]|nr:CBS domain-containing protein [Mariprofundus sp.]
MIAENIMVTNIVTARVDEAVDHALARMRDARLRMIPVVGDDAEIVGVISTFSVLEKVVPSYIVTGDLNHIPYAPDIGILRRHYDEISTLSIAAIMDKNPLTVQRDESLLSVAAAMVSYTKHEYAMVVDDQKRLLGIISAGDVLDRMKRDDDDA